MNNFYVYCYKDQNGPFYIGKGSGTRHLDHLRNAKLHKDNTHFLNRIRKLEREFSPPKVEIIQDNLSEFQAFELEIQLIKQYGRRDKGLGPLLNETDGGDGSSGHISPKKGKTFEELYGYEKASHMKEKIAKACFNRRDQIIELNKKIHTGKTISQEQIEKTIKKTIGQKRSEEQKQTMSNGMKGIKKTLTEEQRKASRERSKNRFENTIIVNNGNSNKRIKLEELQSFLTNGWKRGKKDCNVKEKKQTAWSNNGPKRKCKIHGITYDSISKAAIANKTSAYLIKIDSTFEFLEN
jgi:hypothetical protein